MSRKRRSSSGCIGCGGPCDLDCVDTLGRPYKGCSNGCRFKSEAEIQEMCRAKAGLQESATALVKIREAIGVERVREILSERCMAHDDCRLTEAIGRECYLKGRR